MYAVEQIYAGNDYILFMKFLREIEYMSNIKTQTYFALPEDSKITEQQKSRHVTYSKYNGILY